MKQFISEQEAHNYYSEILQVYNGQQDIKQLQVMKCVTILEKLLKKVTKDDLLHDDVLATRMSFVFRQFKWFQKIKRISTSTRILSNKIRHDGVFPGDEDYLKTFQTLTGWVELSSGVPIPSELEVIYSKKSKEIQLNLPAIKKTVQMEEKRQKLPILFLVDTCFNDDDSAEKLNHLILSIKTFFLSLYEREQARLITEIGLITYNEKASVILHLGEISNQMEQIIHFELKNSKNVISNSLMESLVLANQILNPYKKKNSINYKPWVIIFSSNQSKEKKEELIDSSNNYFILNIGQENNLDTLNLFFSNLKPLSLTKDNYFNFIMWLVESIHKVINVPPNQKLKLPEITNWAKQEN